MGELLVKIYFLKLLYQILFTKIDEEPQNGKRLLPLLMPPQAVHRFAPALPPLPHRKILHSLLFNG